MKPIPHSEHALVLRTDFSSSAVWDAICDEIRRPVDGFVAYVTFVDDPSYNGLTTSQIRALLAHANQSFVIVADRDAMSNPDRPLLVIDLFDYQGRSFRAIPSMIQSIENNLSIANMDFEDFADSVDDDGVFRGFPDW